jgi:hypothetical protein
MPAAALPVEPAKPESLKPEGPVVATADPQAAPEPEPAPPVVADIPLIEPAEVDLSSLTTKADVAPPEAVAVAPAAAPEAAIAALPPSTPAPETPADAVDLGSPSAVIVSPPMPKARPALRARANAKPVAKAAPQSKHRIRTARRANSDDPFGGSFGSSTNSSFKYTQKPFGSSN